MIIIIFKTRNVGPFSGTRLGHVYSKKNNRWIGHERQEASLADSALQLGVHRRLPAWSCAASGAALVLQPHRRLHPVPGRGRSPGLIGGAARSLAGGHESLLREEWSQRTEQRNNQRGEKRRPMGAEATIAGRRRHRRQNPPWAPIHGPIASASTSASAPGNLPHPSGGALVDCTTARRRRKEATVAAMAGPHGKLTHPGLPSIRRRNGAAVTRRVE